MRTPITDGAAGSPGCSATRTSAAGGRTRTATARAGSRAARRRRGCRRASRSASPRSAARRSTAGRTSRTSSTTRSRPRASCRTSPAAGATTPCSAASSRRRSATGPSRRTTRSRGVYSGRMITTAETAAWTWDARPYPAFPARSDVWTDADNWRLGHWLNGRLGSVSLGSLVRELCRRAGLPDSQIDVSALADVVHGYLITALESPRASIAPLARHFGFDAVESEGVIRFQPRDRRPVATLALDDLVGGSDADGEVIELVRAQETELPQALKWQVLRRRGLRRDERRGAPRHRRGAARHLRELRHRHARRRRRPALPPGAARGVGRPRDRVVPAAAVAAGARSGRRRAARPRRPADRAAADQHVADAGARAIEAVRTDASAYGWRRARPRRARVSRPVVYGPPAVAILDLPQLRESAPAHQPLAAVHAVPWPGRVAVLDQPRRGRLQAGDHARPAGADRPAGRAALPRADLAVRPRQRRDRRSRLRHARERHRPRALRRRQRAGGRGGARRLGGAAGRRRRADRARALSALAAAARPARHRGRDGHAGAGRRAGRRARRGAGAAAGPRGGARARGQLALRAGVEAGQRPLVPGARASRPRASACGRSRSPMSGSRGARRASPAIS